MNLEYESQAIAEGYRLIAGVDEAGRGPLAGPVVAGACILGTVHIPGLNDSKKLTESKRTALFEILMNHPDVHCGIGLCTPQEIDHYNILQASLLAMLRAVDNLDVEPNFLLIDGNKIPKTDLPARAIVKGDAQSLSIAAASILAKHTRDQLMLEEHDRYPEYSFAKHKGYPTKEHLEALSLHGPTPIHRLSFGPVKQKVL